MRLAALLTIILTAIAGLGAVLISQETNVINLDLGGNISAPVNPLERKKPKDIEPQKPLANPPDVVKAIYATSWSASSEKRLNYLINLIKSTELNALVVDIKDFSGYIAYNTDLKSPYDYDAVEFRIPKFNALIKRLHDEGIYVIGRVSVFQDPRLALARPELALFSSSTQETWTDNKGLAWIDTASQEAWDYNIDIAKEILERGIDEVNFDYVRFASDGKLSDIVYPFWDETTYKTKIVKDFFARVRERLPEGKISADLFGLVTVNTDGLGIGQHMEFATPYFDAVAPMTYPSHYASGFIGLEKPAEYPYEVIKYSMDRAIERFKIQDLRFKNNPIEKIVATTTPEGIATTTTIFVEREFTAKLRPWFQDFDLGADYDAEMVRAQIRAWEEASARAPQYFGGWMLWNPSNIYTREALHPFYRPPALEPAINTAQEI